MKQSVQALKFAYCKTLVKDKFCTLVFRNKSKISDVFLDFSKEDEVQITVHD